MSALWACNDFDLSHNSLNSPWWRPPVQVRREKLSSIQIRHTAALAYTMCRSEEKVTRDLAAAVLTDALETLKRPSASRKICRSQTHKP